MKDADSAKALARAMIDIGKRFGRRVSAIISNMDIPLGHFVGNTLEVYEAIQVLQGKGEKRLTEICIALASEMISLARCISQDEARELALEAVSSGKALDKMKEWIGAQGGNVSIFDDVEALKGAKYKKEIICNSNGYIYSMPADKIGKASMLLGAGRVKKEDSIDPYAGIEINLGYGSKACVGDSLGYMYSSRNDLFDIALQAIEYSSTANEVKFEPLIYDILR
jgi:pyrimidine-nucleoside phosphorylase